MGANLAVELLGAAGFGAPCDGNKAQFNAGNGRSPIQILLLLDGKDMLLYLGLRSRMREYGRMRM